MMELPDGQKSFEIGLVV